MLDSALSQPLGALAQAPLSATFEDAYAEWLQVFRELAGGGHKAETAAELAAEQGGLLARRLSRAAGARVGAAGQSQIEALQYLFVALIDERLLFEDWPGQSLWQATPLEQRLFGSRAAGDKVPALIERVLRERDPAGRDLANVCLQTLTLGFYGRLRGPGGLAQHEEWRRELFAFAYQRDADIRSLAPALERSSNVPPLRLTVRRMLPDGFRLAVGVAAILVGMSVVGHAFWHDIVSRVEPMLYRGADGDGQSK
ncbi:MULTISPECIES: DotU family type IV/VI secretion system protein [Chromobacterium]|uniref:DotU family type IV/VI secretion system protein n=1 Tax=Chromobacterium TaxID=535 RepID=UPI000D30F9B8|nr:MULTISPECIES: DotU/TssL family secretion system protein [Chromobacterium]PTU65698.1 type VI secretion system protein ImpK [Chromobacterium sp. Panama]UJB29994.1 DotU family type IV/VI secretion system protein [Chromobacterium sp. Beijing]